MDAANRFLFRAVWPKTADAGGVHSFAERLRELRDGREGFFTEDEYQQIRSEILRELVIRPGMPKVMVFALVVVAAGLAGGTIWSFVSGGVTSIWVWLLPLTLTFVIWRRQARDYAAKRRLSVSERLGILDELVAAGLLSQDESARMRGEIQSLPVA